MNLYFLSHHKNSVYPKICHGLKHHISWLSKKISHLHVAHYPVINSSNPYTVKTEPVGYTACHDASCILSMKDSIGVMIYCFP
jgi:hypothetical protein